MIKQRIIEDLELAIKKAGFDVTDIVLSIPENDQFGDYSTNIPLQLANQNSKKSQQSSHDIANQIIEEMGHPSYLERVDVAGPGFINFFIKEEALIWELNEELFTENEGQLQGKYLIEFGHTNPFKEIHIGHLRNFILGESISRILEFNGGEVFRANYHGDIGLHIAKAMWSIKKVDLPSRELTLEQKAKFLGECYAKGSAAYEKDSNAKKEIEELNIRLYEKDSELRELYNIAREWSLDYFIPIYDLLGVKYNKSFFESEVFELGKEIILQNIGPIFEKDNGAIIFPGEKYGLHTRVFITTAGYPTYEGKEIGLAKEEYDTFNYDQSIHVVASEQASYFQVVIKAIELVFPYLEGKKYHLSYGLVDLKQGKMSSRTGNVITIDQLLMMVQDQLSKTVIKENKSITNELAKKVALAAIKFSYLSFSPNTNMVFDLEESVSIHGDSGPYVLYCYARTQSVLKNVSEERKSAKNIKKDKLTPEEREVLRTLEQFSSIVYQAALELHPQTLVNYLLRLARGFNHFYEFHPILKSEHEDFRVALTYRVAETLQKGLYLLGIEVLERM